MNSQKTVRVMFCGSPATAYAERAISLNEQGKEEEYIAVRVYDAVAGHFTVPTTLTPNQERFVIGRTLGK